MDVGLLLLRVIVGLTVAAHGGQKLFGWFGGPGREGFAQFLESLGFRRTRFHTWLAGGAELVGGVFLALGLLTPLAAAAIIGVMITATLAVHVKNGFFAANGGYEFPLLIAVSATAVTLTGPGAYAVDALAGWSVSGAAWALGAVFLAALAAGAVLGARHVEPRMGGSARARTA